MAPAPSSGGVAAMRVAYLKRRAGEELARGDAGRAAASYGEALDALGARRDPGAARVLLGNRSLAWLRAGRADAALADADAALALAPRWAKAHWRRGAALAALRRWRAALAAFVEAWRCSEPGGAEQAECERQLLATVQRLTRQELADWLLRMLQQQGALPAAAPPPASDADGRLCLVVAPGGALAPAAADELAGWWGGAEAREALFQVVAAAAPPRGLGPHHALLLRWLTAGGGGATAPAAPPRPGRPAGPAVVAGVEAQLLASRLAARLRRWPTARAAAEAAEAALRVLVLRDAQQLCQLAVECYDALGDACMAGGAAPGAAPCAPGDAARAFMTALALLLPDGAAAAAGPRERAELGAWRAAPAEPGKLRAQLQAKLAAARELLDDAAHAAAAAAVAAAVGAAAGAGDGGGGRQLALMQLGLAAPPPRAQPRAAPTPLPPQGPLLLVALTLASKPPAPAGRDLPGAARVALLGGLARAAGVPRLAAGLVRAAGPGLTVNVQFGEDAAAAHRFLALCSSAESLAGAWPELPAALAPAGASAAGGGAGFVVASAQLVDLNTATSTPEPDAMAASEQAEQAGALAAEPAGAAHTHALALPYAHYALVRADGTPLERPSKHPFGLTRVLHDARELPDDGAVAWCQPADLPLRWRQTAGTVLVQLHGLPASVTSARQLRVALAPCRLAVALAASGEVLLEGELTRGIAPDASTWTLESPPPRPSVPAGPAGGCAALAAAPGGAGEGVLLLELTKLNLELYETCARTGAARASRPARRRASAAAHAAARPPPPRARRPWQHSASWWPRLFADDPADVAWDDAAHDYSDLPPAVAAAHAAQAAAEAAAARADAARREERRRLERLLQRHRRARAERLRELAQAAMRGHLWVTCMSGRLVRLAGPHAPRPGAALQALDLGALLPPPAGALPAAPGLLAVTLHAGARGRGTLALLRVADRGGGRGGVAGPGLARAAVCEVLRRWRSELGRFVLRTEVLKLYRTFLRTARALPASSRGDVLAEVRREFELQRSRTAPYDIKYALSDGRTRLRYLEEAIGFSR
ncbi:TTC28 [Scenedesmus sp. PABB004]|nr:TTC28 [Scenedesmus sp. PABB004]